MAQPRLAVAKIPLTCTGVYLVDEYRKRVKRVKAYRAMLIASQQVGKFDPSQVAAIEQQMKTYLKQHPEIWDDVKPLGAGGMET